MTTPSTAATRSPEVADQPLISVVIATRNRSEMLRDSVHSVLCQTYRNLEVIVVDDGSEDATQQAVESIADPRVRYVRQAPGGISSARNRGTEHARGEWIAVHDDDDLMLPFRLAAQLEHANDQVDFVYGAFINFDDDTGELQMHHGRNYSYGAALMSGFAPGHSTWLVRTETMRRFPYDEGIASAVDNNLVFRMLRSGVRFRHSGVICLLRRVHGGRVTSTGGAQQKYVADLNLQYLGRGVSAQNRARLVADARFDWGPVDKTHWQTRYLAYLPDHLVVRNGHLSFSAEADHDGADSAGSAHYRLSTADVAAMDWWSFLDASSRAESLDSVRARPRESDELEQLFAESSSAQSHHGPDLSQEALALLFRTAVAKPGHDYFAIAAQPAAQWTAEQICLTTARCTIETDGGDLAFGLVPVRSWAAANSLRDAAFSTAAAFRILSTKPPADIAAELDAPA